MKSRKIAGWILMGIGMLALIGAVLFIAFEVAVTDGNVYTGLQNSNGVTAENTGISDADRMLLNGDLADYLTGENRSLTREATVFGIKQTAFNDRERAHMEDVGALFDLERMVRTILLGCAVLCIALGLWLVPDRRLEAVSHTFDAALLLVVLVGGISAIFVCNDFNRVFIRFHELFFTNELWQMDPATDLMIRMLPEGFFSDIVRRAGIFMGVAAVVLIVLMNEPAHLVQYRRRRKNRKEEQR